MLFESLPHYKKQNDISVFSIGEAHPDGGKFQAPLLCIFHIRETSFEQGKPGGGGSVRGAAERIRPGSPARLRAVRRCQLRVQRGDQRDGGARGQEDVEQYWNAMLCKTIKTQEDAVGILMWRARVYLGKAIHHANANFPLSQVRGMTGDELLDDRSTQYSLGTCPGGRPFGPYGAPSAMVGHASRRWSHVGSRLFNLFT
jgi:hypothetical protein